MRKRTLHNGVKRARTLVACLTAGAAAALMLGVCPAALAQGDDESGGFDYLDYPYHKIIEEEAAQCGQCHRKAVAAWQQTRHAKTFDELHLKERAQEIVKAMGGRSITRSKICTQCHYTMYSRSEGGRAKAVMGVSCQRCHGPAADWLGPHSDTDAMPDKAARLAQSEDLLMRPTYKLYELARSCFECHMVPKEDLVNVGGHNAGSENFELVAWSQGEIRHNFLPLPDEPANKERDQDYLRRLYVMGKLLEGVFAMNGLAAAESDGAYKTTMIERVNSVREDLQAIGSSSLSDAVGAIPADPASASADALTSAADKVAQAAKSISDSRFEGFDFGNAASQLPDKSEYKGEAYTG